jgi:hypothetical protein
MVGSSDPNSLPSVRIVATGPGDRVGRLARHLPPRLAAHTDKSVPSLRLIVRDLDPSARSQVMLELRHRSADGTKYLMFEPLELLERLASLPPRPRINLLLYYGVLGARSAWRSGIAASGRASSATSLPVPGDQVH